MGIYLRTQTIRTLLEDKLDCKTFEDVSDMLDDIDLLSDAKDDALKEAQGNTNSTTSSKLTLHDVSQRSELLKAISDLKDFAYEVCPLHREDDLHEIVNRL